MMRPTRISPHVPFRRRAGFTMVEMLIVIGIILILVSILLPVVARIRIQVRVAQTQQEMSKIAGAIDQYYLEFNHAYPGPFSNVNVTPSNSAISITNVNGGNVNPTSTENMVLGLCGGLEIASNNLQYNSNDIQSGLGPLNLNPNIAKQTRHATFIDATPSKEMPDLPWDGTPGNGTQGLSDSNIPEFMDKFNAYNGGFARPILYLRARIGNPTNAGTTTAQVCGADNTTAQYNYSHLYPYAGPNDFFQFPGSGSTFGTTDATLANSSVAPYYVQGTSATNNPAFTTWDTYLANPNQYTSPRGVNAYILISAGPDGVFGTTDDLFYP
jgi:prepilin-type N-terminal cleavage/methylation domain-containing protein